MLSALLTMLLVFSDMEITTTTCPAPTNVQAIPLNVGFLIDWDDCGCTFSSYKLKYYRHGVGFSQDYSTGTSSYSFGELQAGTYDVYVWIDCGDASSEAIVIEDLISN